MDWPRDFDYLDDDEFEEHRQKLSDDEEDRVMQDDFGSESCHPLSAASFGTGDQSSSDKGSKFEAEALPNSGLFWSPLQGRGHEPKVRSDGSINGEDSFDHAGFDKEDGCDSGDVDRMDICDSGNSEDRDHHYSAADIDDDHRGYLIDGGDSCDELEVGSADYDDDLNGYEADVEDSRDHSATSFAGNHNGSDADIEDNCPASKDDFESRTQATVED